MRLVDADIASIYLNMEACEQIKNMPTVDAVPVIRCKDCKHRIDDFCMSFARYGIKENGFCDKAKRKGDNYETNR